MPRAVLMPMKNAYDQISLIPLALSLPFEKSCTNLKPVPREIVRLTPKRGDLPCSRQLRQQADQRTGANWLGHKHHLNWTKLNPRILRLMSQAMKKKCKQQTPSNPHCSRDTLSAGTHHALVASCLRPIPRITSAWVDEAERMHGGALVGKVPPLVGGQPRDPIFLAQMCSLGVLPFSQILHFGCQRENW